MFFLRRLQDSNRLKLKSTLFLRRKSKSICGENTNTSVLPTQAQVIICGAGSVANSVAYHLIENGWSDVILIDKGRICEGTSHFGSGTLGLFKPIEERNIILYSIKLYRKLQAKGFDIGLKQCGSLNLAQTPDRMIDLKRRIAYNVPTGLHCEILDKYELKKLHPFLYTDDLEGAVWVPEDTIANSQAICKILAQLSLQGGAQYIENCNVEKVITENGAVKGVQTNKGFISCEYFVNCAGMVRFNGGQTASSFMTTPEKGFFYLFKASFYTTQFHTSLPREWARELGWLCTTKVRVPVYPAEHFYVTTRAMRGVTRELPYVRDFDSGIYIRQYYDGFMMGGFEPVAKPAFTSYRLIPEDWKNTLPADWEHFTPLWGKATVRIPALKEAVYPVLTNSPDTFTPDGRWIIGETPEVRNYFVAVGMNGNPLQGAGGIGRAVAEWIIAGEPTHDLLPFDVRRFLDLHNNRQYLQERTKEIVGRRYSIHYPHQSEYKCARNLRCSPLYSILEKRGSIFETRMGFERPLYFDTKSDKANRRLPPPTFYQPKFLSFMIDEYYACREGVGIIDMSSFSKTRISGQNHNAVKWLQKLCSNDVNVGGIIHTGMQNEKGGYENDCILVRESENSYLMVSPTSQQTKCFHWMRRFLPSDGSVDLKDVTSMYSVLNVVGPKARPLLSELSQSNINLHPFTCKELNIGYASDVMMMSFTHTGEQGFSLYVPSEYAIHVYNSLITVGKDYGVLDVGALTQRYMRIEKFIPFWGEDLNSNTTPFESGNSHKVKLDKEYFIGKFALQKQKNEGVTKRLVMFTLDDLNPEMDIWAWGSEPIYRNDEFVGIVTSAGYGFTSKKLVCLGYVSQPGYYRERSITKRMSLIVKNNFIMDSSTVYKIDVAGRRFNASPHISPPLSTISSYNDLSNPYKPEVYPSVVQTLS